MMLKICAGAAIVAACLVGESDAFSVPSSHALPLALGKRASCSSSITSVKMGLFDAIGKAMNDAMAPDTSLGKAQNPGFREGYEGPRPAVATFVPGGQKVQTYAGERLGDVARKAGVSITYGCQKAIIPKQPGSGEMQFQIEMPEAKISMARKLAWEDVKNGPKK